MIRAKEFMVRALAHATNAVSICVLMLQNISHNGHF